GHSDYPKAAHEPAVERVIRNRILGDQVDLSVGELSGEEESIHHGVGVIGNHNGGAGSGNAVVPDGVNAAIVEPRRLFQQRTPKAVKPVTHVMPWSASGFINGLTFYHASLFRRPEWQHLRPRRRSEPLEANGRRPKWIGPHAAVENVLGIFRNSE